MWKYLRHVWNVWNLHFKKLENNCQKEYKQGLFLVVKVAAEVLVAVALVVVE